jgi:hypothetical protein
MRIEMFSTGELVLKTIDHLDNNPQCYRYTSNLIPQSSCQPGCVLGWMAHFSGERGVLTPSIIARITCDPIFSCDVGYNDFFRRLDECYPLHLGHWRSNATHAIAALRAYATKYPAAPALPVWARMRDREARVARQSYDQFRASLDLGRLPDSQWSMSAPAAHLASADANVD